MAPFEHVASCFWHLVWHCSCRDYSSESPQTRADAPLRACGYRQELGGLSLRRVSVSLLLVPGSAPEFCSSWPQEGDLFLVLLPPDCGSFPLKVRPRRLLKQCSALLYLIFLLPSALLWQVDQCHEARGLSPFLCENRHVFAIARDLGLRPETLTGLS